MSTVRAGAPPRSESSSKNERAGGGKQLSPKISPRGFALGSRTRSTGQARDDHIAPRSASHIVEGIAGDQREERLISRCQHGSLRRGDDPGGFHTVGEGPP